MKTIGGCRDRRSQMEISLGIPQKDGKRTHHVTHLSGYTYGVPYCPRRDRCGVSTAALVIDGTDLEAAKMSASTWADKCDDTQNELIFGGWGVWREEK